MIILKQNHLKTITRKCNRWKNYLWSWTWIKIILCRKNKKYPFREGNTRTTALFIEKYLESREYYVDNSMFKEKSVYYRNTLVRSNYLNIKQDNSFLIKFYENLLLGKNNNLHSRDLIVEELFNKENC